MPGGLSLTPSGPPLTPDFLAQSLLASPAGKPALASPAHPCHPGFEGHQRELQESTVRGPALLGVRAHEGQTEHKWASAGGVVCWVGCCGEGRGGQRLSLV
eukprot:1158290-Pelagomonas_calceolata.AAC.1